VTRSPLQTTVGEVRCPWLVDHPPSLLAAVGILRCESVTARLRQTTELCVLLRTRATRPATDRAATIAADRPRRFALIADAARCSLPAFARAVLAVLPARAAERAARRPRGAATRSTAERRIGIDARIGARLLRARHTAGGARARVATIALRERVAERVAMPVVRARPAPAVVTARDEQARQDQKPPHPSMLSRA